MLSIAGTAPSSRMAVIVATEGILGVMRRYAPGEAVRRVFGPAS
jgi:hypothetical protein